MVPTRIMDFGRQGKRYRGSDDTWNSPVLSVSLPLPPKIHDTGWNHWSLLVPSSMKFCHGGNPVATMVWARSLFGTAVAPLPKFYAGWNQKRPKSPTRTMDLRRQGKRCQDQKKFFGLGVSSPAAKDPWYGLDSLGTSGSI
jgi:hypothetical protein